MASKQRDFIPSPKEGPTAGTRVVQVKLQISEDRIASLLVGAFEGGSNYWIDHINHKPYEDVVPGAVVGEPRWAEMRLRLPATVWEDTSEEPDGVDGSPRARTLDEKAIQRGLDLMANNWPRHFAQWMTENDDAETSDVFLQLCLLGDIVYG